MRSDSKLERLVRRNKYYIASRKKLAKEKVVKDILGILFLAFLLVLLFILMYVFQDFWVNK